MAQPDHSPVSTRVDSASTEPWAADEADHDRQEAMLHALVEAAERFLQAPDWRTEVPVALKAMGEAAGVSRVSVFENQIDPDGELLTSCRFEWVAPGVEPHKDSPTLQDLSLRQAGLSRWQNLMAVDSHVAGPVDDFPEEERDFLRSFDICSIAAVPVISGGRWWGFIAFDDCIGERVWSTASLAVLRTAADLIGAAAEQTRVQQALRESEQRFQRLVEATREGVLIHDGRTILDVNPSAVSLVGAGSAAAVIGHSPFSFIAPEHRALAIAHVEREWTEPYEVTVVRADGSTFPAELQGGSIPYHDRLVRFVSVRDLTLRKNAEENEKRVLLERAARAEAEASGARADFLAEVSRVLASSFDYQTTLARVARLAVPYLADYCLIDVLDGEKVRRVATAYGEDDREELARQLEQFVPDLQHKENPIARVLRTGRSILAESAAELDPEVIARDPEHLALLREIGPRSALFVPVRVRERTAGVISLISARASRVYEKPDLALAEDVAGRTGLALGNALLFHDAQQATRARDEVLSVVAHDLRNPLGVVINGVELINEIGASDRQAQVIERVLRSAKGMNRLIGDLLEVSRLERGALGLELAEHAVGRLVSDAASMLQPLAEAQSIEFQLRLEQEEMSIRADSVRLQQVFSNLVGNAVKFTPRRGRIVVESVLSGQHVRFGVIDSGPGIPPDQLPHIFSQFWQGNRADQRGLGLGLAIAKGLVEAHQGRIWVESQPGSGAQFYFTIPRA